VKTSELMQYNQLKMEYMRNLYLPHTNKQTCTVTLAELIPHRFIQHSRWPG